MKGIFIAIAAWLFACSCYAQDADFVLEGTVGKYPIVMHVVSRDGKCDDMRYFYKRKKQDLSLDGIYIDKGSLQLHRNGMDAEDSTAGNEFFSLRIKSDGSWAGTWHQNKKSLPVALKPVSNHRYHSVYDGYECMRNLKQDDLYNYLRLKDIVFDSSKNDSSNGVSYRLYFDSLSRVTAPQLLSGYNPMAIKTINDRLMNYMLEAINNSLSCVAFGQSGDYDQDVISIFCGRGVMSVAFFVSSFCGGAHPDFAPTGFTFDAMTGKELAFGSLFSPEGIELSTDPESNEPNSDTFGVIVVRKMASLYPEEFDEREAGDECDYSDPEVWKYAEWYLTEEGLHLCPTFARVIRSCDDPGWSVIPYAELDDWINPDSKTELPAE